MVGAGLGAVHTVTALPPPCGTSAMLSNFTPMVAQSSEGASLTIRDMLAVAWVPEPEEPEALLPELPPPPPPQALRLAESAATTAQ
jgi:hypothetical protein